MAQHVAYNDIQAFNSLYAKPKVNGYDNKQDLCPFGLGS
jgi:hypothetical protein